MADLLDCVVIEVEQEGHGREHEHWRDDGVRVLLAEVEGIIVACLGRGDMPESAMWFVLDGVPESIIFEAADRLGVTVRGGVWRMRRRA